MQVVSDNVSKGQHIVSEDEGQYLVCNDPNSSDPTHSMLSKDHFRYRIIISLNIVATSTTQLVNSQKSWYVMQSPTLSQRGQIPRLIHTAQSILSSWLSV